jgi:hypothetical protein
MANTIQAAVAEATAAILDETGALSREYTVARERISSLHSAGWPTTKSICGRVRVRTAFRPANSKSANARSPA